jgi:hypothetical protein
LGRANYVVVAVFDECGKGDEEDGAQIAILHVKSCDTGADAVRSMLNRMAITFTIKSSTSLLQIIKLTPAGTNKCASTKI